MGPAGFCYGTCSWDPEFGSHLGGLVYRVEIQTVGNKVMVCLTRNLLRLDIRFNAKVRILMFS